MNELEIRALYQKLVALRSDPARTNCASPEEILALAETSLPEAERLRLLRHVSACSFCQHDLSVARSVAATRQPTPWLPRWGGLSAVAALAAAAAVLVVVVLVWRPGARTPEVMRSSDDAIVLLQPAGNIGPTDTIFAWRPVPGAQHYHIEVLTAGGALVHTTQTADTSVAVPRRALARSEYFWRVTASLTDGSTRASAAHRFIVR